MADHDSQIVVAPFDSHKHDYLEISYAYFGSFTQVINGQIVEMKEGDLTILDTDVIHTINKVGEETIIINILLRKNYFILSRLTENDLISEFVIDAIYKPSINGRFFTFHLMEMEKSGTISVLPCANILIQILRPLK
ncbi:AraC family ligand binding domain-containing protein [Niallia sp. NCCP-28]|uniref:AraC family ligand binding domain-containing protein n=1 Tax=Niallia sp. NCCP-28 TaxID=2934712 RepID=UPI0020BFC676|nr:AraC family ligand binding domain-containing protein [Niallia sp. NCCP-28]